MTRENVCQGTFSRITRRSRGQRHSEVGRGSTSLHARRPARVGGLEKVAGAYLQGAPAPVRSRETGSSWVLWGGCAVAGGAAVVVAVVTVFDGGGRDVVVVAQVGSAARRRSAPDGGGSRGACGPGGDRVPGPFAHAPHTPTPGPVRDGPGRPGANPIARPRLIGALPGRGHGHSIPHGFRPSTTPRTIHSAPARTHRARRTARERHRDRWPSAHLTQERRHCARAGELAYQP